MRRHKGQFSHHEECPACREVGQDSRRDNLGVWKDGSKYCFKCGFYVGAGVGLNIESLMQRVHKKKKDNDSPSIALPYDFTYDLPGIALEWIRKYGITDQEIQQNHFGWSNKYESLVLPVFDCFGNLLMYQNRFFGEGAKRYFTSGQPDLIYHVLGSGAHNDSVVCVEDLLSAIKVSRVAQAMPLWGSTLSMQRLRTLGERLVHSGLASPTGLPFTNLVIWLDKDKAGYAIKRAQAAKPFFDDVRVIVTDLDPKQYSTEEIQMWLK